MSLFRHYGILIDIHRNLHKDSILDEGESSLVPFGAVKRKVYLNLTAQNRSKLGSFNFRVCLELD